MISVLTRKVEALERDNNARQEKLDESRHVGGDSFGQTTSSNLTSTPVICDNNISARHNNVARGENRVDNENVRLRDPLRNNDNVLGNIRLPKGGWLKDPFENICFLGRTDKQNPIRFLQKFEKIASYEEINERDQLHYFAKCMHGSASLWYEMRDFANIREAKFAFREYFWNDEQQSRLREQLYTGKYCRAECKLSMSEYAMNLARQAKCLKPPLSDSEIIRCVKRHFGTQIACEIRPSTVVSFEDFVNLLDQLYNESLREKEESAMRQNRKY